MKITKLENHEIATQLISLLNITRADVARATKNNPANLSQWLQGRDKLLSSNRQESVLEWLGLINGKLDGDRIHCWMIGNNFDALRDVLQSSETPTTLATLTIYQVEAYKQSDIKSPVILKFDRTNGPVMIALTRTKSAGKHPLILNASSLGFGKNGQEVIVPSEYFEKYFKEISPNNLCSQIDLKVSNTSLNTFDVNTNQHIHHPDQKLLEMENVLRSLQDDISYLRSHEAGLRAVIRAALNEIRLVDMNNQILREDVRKAIYDEFSLSELNKESQNNKH